MNVAELQRGSSPLLISVPHDGRELAPGMADRMTPSARQLPDTDWHVRKLYDFASDLNATLLAANYSRYVVDLNRAATDEMLYPGQFATGLCPQQTFAGDPVYRAATGCSEPERAERIGRYWQPYHDQLCAELVRIREQFGYALLWDAHSIPARVPLLFDGRLPDLNIGTNDSSSCAKPLERAVADAACAAAFSSVLNGRFRGGYITRHYGRPEEGVHALQLELAQSVYMDENDGSFDATRAAELRPVLRAMLQALLEAAADL